ncbi:geranylgeranyl pyrophosphate synthetase [Terramyces sp. JEL0728]|nr:geranylgeranyl pyrophosphate synthetase [Terramyces sp. JEL0728]
MEAQSNFLLAPYEYLVENPGKDFRSKLIAAFNLWLHVPPEKLDQIKEIVAMLHTASLLVDDVEDGSELRRGQPVAHKIFGVASTINSAKYIILIQLQKTMQLGDSRAVEIFTQELLNLHNGQGSEIHWRDNVSCPTEDEYLMMVSNSKKGLR